eukprot:393403-Pyramimonas_sp.AAC.1
MLRGVEGGMDAQSRTFLFSLTGPTEDHITALRLVWPPDLGGANSRNECDVLRLRAVSKYPTNQALAWSDSNHAEELLLDGATAESGKEGDALYRFDSEMYKLQQAPDVLVGSPLDVLTFLLNHRAIDKEDRARVNEVENTRMGSSSLLSRARATIEAK